MTAGRSIALVLLAAAAAAANFAIGLGLGAAPLHIAGLAAGPLLVAVAALVSAPRVVPATSPAAPPPAAAPVTPALRLLAALQEDGRLVDFLQEDIAAYSDEQIGAAVRGIHEPCRKALRACVTLEPVLRGDEGQDVTLEPGFDPSAVRLVGNVAGSPPFRGVLRHGGWRVTATNLPARGGQDEQVIAPAEVELS